MIQKQMKRLEEHQMYINNLSASEIEHSLIRQDFYQYNCMHKNQKLVFEENTLPESALLQLIEDCAVGSYDELEQLEIRLKEIIGVKWDYDKIAELREKYLQERHQIVGSGLALKELAHLLEPGDEKDIGDPLFTTFSALMSPMPDKPYLYQFLDSAFSALEQHKEKEEMKIKCSIKEGGDIEFQLGEQKNGRNNQKVGEIIGLFSKMAKLLSNNQEEEEDSCASGLMS